jgi:hypothetical protein
MKPLKLFVIQPYNKHHSDTFFRLIKEVTDEELKGEFKAYRADSELSDAGSLLQERIISYIKKADICIADIVAPYNKKEPDNNTSNNEELNKIDKSKSVLNEEKSNRIESNENIPPIEGSSEAKPNENVTHDKELGKRELNKNVLYEVGAAFALDIPVILVNDKGSLPSDFSNNLYINCDTNKLAFLKEVDKVIYKEDEAKDTCEEFKRVLKDRLKEVQRKNMMSKKPQFFVQGFKNRKEVDFYDLIKRCQKRIWILTTNLDFIVNETLHCGFGSEKRSVLDMIYEEQESKPPEFSIRILTLEPDSNFTNDRATSLLKDKSEFREDMRTGLKAVKTFVDSEYCKLQAEIRTYDAYPLQMTYFFDDNIVSSVVNSSSKSRDCITYCHKLDEIGSGETYEKHFEQLWSKGIKVAKSSVQKKSKDTWEPNLKNKGIYFDKHGNLGAINVDEIESENERKEKEKKEKENEINFNKGKLCYGNGKYDEAIKLFEDVYNFKIKESETQKSICDLAEICYMLGICYNNKDLAKDDNLKNSKKYFLEAKVKLITKKSKESSERLKEVGIWTCLLEGVSSYQNKEFEKAIQHLEIVRDSEILSKEICYYLGICYKEKAYRGKGGKVKVNDIENAINYLEKAKSKYLEIYNSEKSQTKLETSNNLEKIKKELNEVYCIEGKNEFGLREYDRAKLFFDKIYKPGSQSADIYYYLGVCCKELEKPNFNNALKYFNEAKHAKTSSDIESKITLDEIQKEIDEIGKQAKC